MVECSSGSNNAFGKTICSICYEDLKPIVEDLQSISFCGHVFHELCIQQWFEYCSNGKKKSCPVCKQTCSEASVNRLYFQSVGDSALTQRQTSCDENPAELHIEIEKLRGKVVGLSSALEQGQKVAKQLGEQLCSSKEQTKKEAALKDDALRENAAIHRLFLSKIEDANRAYSECRKLQEQNMALAKELAALKLASDLNLEEEEVLKLASLGNGANNNDKVDVLNKTLVIRNKSYKELMAKCNAMGRGEARCLRKLEKKKEKMKKLKMRIQELERASEAKENDVLRALKRASKRTSQEGSTSKDVSFNMNTSFINNDSNSRLKNGTLNFDHSGSRKDDLYSPSEMKKFKSSNGIATTNTKCDTSPTTSDMGMGGNYSLDGNVINVSSSTNGISRPTLQPHIIEDFSEAKKGSSSQKAASSVGKSEDIAHENFVKGEGVHAFSAPVDDDDVVLILDDIKQVESNLPIEKETPRPTLIAQPGDICFSGGLLAPDGTLRHLGKWCKRAQSKGSVAPSAQGLSGTNSDLIAVGADGRGGKIKVLRSLNQSSESRENSASTKRYKLGAKTSGLQSHGRLQIEHFFGKA